MENKIYQIKIELIGSKPLIWRRLIVNSNTLLVDVHRIIQTAMGWTNSHLHSFSDGTEEYAPIEFEMGTKDSRKVKLDSILNKENPKITYEYDFGDGWEHNIFLEEIVIKNKEMQIPSCLAGKNNCPPEDCGGVYGYANMLSILKKPGHEEYESYLEWLGGEFDPEYFDMNEINKLLKQKDFGCIWLLANKKYSSKSQLKNEVNNFSYCAFYNSESSCAG